MLPDDRRNTDSKESAIIVEGLSKRYRIGLKDERPDTLAGAVARFLRRPVENYRRLRSLSRFKDDDEDSSTIWALRDVSFRVDRGDVVGIIGRNGAGKSTLLKILSRVSHPTEGSIAFRGRISSLLEVGTGFHPELTGRENVYLNGTILGMTRREIDERFDDIASFSEVEAFLETPVKRYSSGMRLRLAFAVAAHLEPEILLIDEVLAVGDSAFQQKCVGRIGEVARSGRTVLFVSHNLAVVKRLCNRGIVLDQGAIVFDGTALEAAEAYRKMLPSASASWEAPSDEARDEALRLRSARIVDANGFVCAVFSRESPIYVELEVDVLEPTEQVRVGFDLETEWETLVLRSFHNDEPDGKDSLAPGRYHFRMSIPPKWLAGQTYFVSPCAGIHRRRWLFQKSRLLSFEVEYQESNAKFVHGERPGIIAPILSWDVQVVGD